jgi:hypothetical protein
MTNSIEFLKSLRLAAWRTSSARYNAARRLRQRESIATLSIALFAAISVAITLVQKIYALRPESPADNYVTAVVTVIGLFVIVISLVESGASNGVKAELLHRNAEELNSFQRKLEQMIAGFLDGQGFAPSELSALREEYENAKQRCQYNHEPLDSLRFDADHRLSSEFSDGAGKPRIGFVREMIVRLQYWLQPNFYFIVLWILVVALVWAAPWGAIFGSISH